MRFPKLELDIDQYMQSINDLLVAADCHLFIDTNIISQLYKLNDDARADFFSWVSTVSSRFHIPNWVVHEYQKRYVGQKTKDYLTELDNKDLVNRLKNLSTFAKGYIGDSLLVGSIYQGKKDDLFSDLDDLVDKFEKIHKAITKRLPEHQLKVHTDILQNLQPYTMPTDFYSILEDLDYEGDIRYKHLIPPGFEDEDKESNKFGDLIIWREILDYCDSNEVKKAIWITRDAKTDMAYTPQRQTMGGNPVNDKIAIAHESLVYEFSQTAGSEDFYIINFMLLVKCLASNYQNLAISFQIVTAPGQTSEIEAEADLVTDTPDVHQPADPPLEPMQPENPNAPVKLYSNAALADMGFEDKCADPLVNLIIRNLKSYNWYKQNEAIQNVLKGPIAVDLSTTMGRDMIFVLGRNIYQSAVGAAHEAMSFVERLNVNIHDWDVRAQKALVDGMLYEVFFNSKGEIRPKSFKALYYQVLLRETDLLGIETPYGFINSRLHDQTGIRFVPEVHTDKHYTFEFEYTKDQFGQAITKSLKINGEDVSETFTQTIAHTFAAREELSAKLSQYYAIPTNQIKIANLEADVTLIQFIGASSVWDL